MRLFTRDAADWKFRSLSTPLRAACTSGVVRFEYGKIFDTPSITGKTRSATCVAVESVLTPLFANLFSDPDAFAPKRWKSNDDSFCPNLRSPIFLLCLPV